MKTYQANVNVTAIGFGCTQLQATTLGVESSAKQTARQLATTAMSFVSMQGQWVIDDFINKTYQKSGSRC